MSQDDGTRRLFLYRLPPQTRMLSSSEVNLPVLTHPERMASRVRCRSCGCPYDNALLVICVKAIRLKCTSYMTTSRLPGHVEREQSVATGPLRITYSCMEHVHVVHHAYLAALDENSQ